MKEPIHFEVAKVLTSYDKILAASAEKAKGNPFLETQHRAGATFGRAFMQFLTQEKNLGTDHVIVAKATGAMFASILGNLRGNYSCPCTMDRALAALEHAVSEIEKGKSAFHGKQSVPGIKGGHA